VPLSATRQDPQTNSCLPFYDPTSFSAQEEEEEEEEEEGRKGKGSKQKDRELRLEDTPVWTCCKLTLDKQNLKPNSCLWLLNLVPINTCEPLSALWLHSACGAYLEYFL
jgi:hypothetical protein